MSWNPRPSGEIHGARAREAARRDVGSGAEEVVRAAGLRAGALPALAAAGQVLAERPGGSAEFVCVLTDSPEFT